MLGFDVVKDGAFFQFVAARVIEPTSMSDSRRVLSELGIDPVHRNSFHPALRRCEQRQYKHQIARKCFEQVWASGDVSLVLYDVTTLCFEAENEHELRKVGYSKEHRVDPEILVGPLADWGGFPLEIGCFEGNKANTKPIVPIIRQFQARHGIEDMVVVAITNAIKAA